MACDSSMWMTWIEIVTYETDEGVEQAPRDICIRTDTITAFAPANPEKHSEGTILMVSNNAILVTATFDTVKELLT